MKIDDLKSQGVATVEQIMATLTAVQIQTGSSQQVGSSSGGAALADLRGIGASKTLVLLNGRRIANNAIDGSAPDLNMIPFAALERVEVLRDGASSLYGTDAIGGVINFITRKDYRGGIITVPRCAPPSPVAVAGGGVVLPGRQPRRTTRRVASRSDHPLAACARGPCRDGVRGTLGCTTRRAVQPARGAWLALGALLRAGQRLADLVHATFRPFTPLARGTPRPFDKDECLAKLSKAKTHTYGWDISWIDMKM